MARARPSDSGAVVARPQTAVSTKLDYGADAGFGFEDATKDAYAIPFLTILQSGSPQCKKSDGAYIKGAEEGMIFNTVTNELFADGVTVIPCAFAQSFVEWNLREQGGGFVAEYDSVAGTALRQQAHRDDKNREILPNGHQLNDTRNHYVLFKDHEGYWQPAMMSLTSTQIRASRNWMTTMQRLCATNKAPMFALQFQINTAPQQNDKGTWFGYTFEYLGLVDDEDTYTSAKAFYEQARSGLVKTQQRDAMASAEQTRSGDGFEDDM